MRVSAEPVRGLTHHEAGALYAGLEDRVVDVGDHPEAGPRAGHPHPDARAVRAGPQAAIAGGELDVAVLPRADRRRRVQLGAEVAFAVGAHLDDGVAHGDAQRDVGQLVGDEVGQAAAQRGADALALQGDRRRRVVEDPSAHHHAGSTAVPLVALDAEVLRDPAALAHQQPALVPDPLRRQQEPLSASHGTTMAELGCWPGPAGPARGFAASGRAGCRRRRVQ